ncbi:hypothetical protein E0H92_02460 [Kribbella speibonae]|uniref:Uncharacterized protein n=1 Tax=Kribbella speibonae TaxID=1572660 RepID=A0A4R0JDN5_9ACTN|nr:hypothetical protein E0H92_02460 [Kribbella speibonae]
MRAGPGSRPPRRARRDRPSPRRPGRCRSAGTHRPGRTARCWSTSGVRPHYEPSRDPASARPPPRHRRPRPRPRLR